MVTRHGVQGQGVVVQEQGVVAVEQFRAVVRASGAAEGAKGNVRLERVWGYPDYQ